MAQQELPPSATLANIIPTLGWDGLLYSVAIPLTSTEADLWGGTGVQTTDPVQVAYGQVVLAIVQLTINGIVVGQNSYVVMQVDFGDGVWIDAAWIVWTGGQGTATFVMSAGGLGAMNNAFQQSRQAGAAPNPQANGSNNIPLGGRIRFVGKSTFVGGSSSLAGVTTSVSATIKYKLMSPR